LRAALNARHAMYGTWNNGTRSPFFNRHVIVARATVIRDASVAHA
jgi:hypothetical protein